MQRKNLPDAAPGKYVDSHPYPFYSPEKLPVEPKFNIPDEVDELVADAAYQIGRVDGISSTVNFSASLYVSLIRLEAVESARIEGADVDFQEVQAYRTQNPEKESESEVKKDLREALNYEDALMHGIDIIEKGGNITLNLIKRLHAILLDGVRNEGDVVGEFRDHPVRIPSPVVGRRPFIPPTHEIVPELMESLESYLQEGGAYHPLVDAAIIHYFFETVHPFSDGNGRLGRLIIILYLMTEGYLESPYLNPSGYIERHKVQYVERMRAVSEKGEWNEWFQFFIEGLHTQAKRSYDRTWDLLELQSAYKAEYDGSTSTDECARRLLEKPYFAAPELAEFLDVSRMTAYRVIENLEDDGLIEEVTGKEKGKEYKAVDVFDIIQ